MAKTADKIYTYMVVSRKDKSFSNSLILGDLVASSMSVPMFSGRGVYARCTDKKDCIHWICIDDLFLIGEL